MPPIIEKIVKSFGPKAVAYYDREPVKVHTAITSAVVAGLAVVGVVVSSPAVLAVAAVVVPLLIGELRNVVASPVTQQALLEAQPPETVESVREDVAATPEAYDATVPAEPRPDAENGSY